MALSEAVQAARAQGYGLLRGDGIEIGALHEPARLPAAARVRYVDALTAAQARELFPELQQAPLTDPDVIADLDRAGLSAFAGDSLDFVVLSHVLEHLANPLQAIAEVFRVLRPGGRAAIGIPDKRFTFDAPRALTPFLHVWQDYLDRPAEVTDDHYIDFIKQFVPVHAMTAAELQPHLAGVRRRREHAHVWDSGSFHELLLLTLPLTGWRARPLLLSTGDANRFEYFSVWEKKP